MSLEHQPLTLATFADGNLAADVNAALADILERFRQAEDGEIKLANERAEITIKLRIERAPSVGGFVTSYQEVGVKLPPRVSCGTTAVVRDGVFVVAVESDGTQLPLPRSNNA